MVKEELIIGGYRVELIGSLNPNLTLNIADITNPDKRKADFSKTITLPGSKRINKIFEHIFEVNLALQTFNPNRKTSVVYLVDGETSLDGFLQLKKVNITDKNDITYEVTIIGRIGDFLTDVGNSYLTDLNLSSLDHTYNKTQQAATWNLPLTTDYVYPMINYDINYGNYTTGQSEAWLVEDFYPAIKVFKYIDEIFKAVDYTFSSTFFDSAFFNTLIVPFSALDNKLTMAEINTINFKADEPVFASNGLTTTPVPTYFAGTSTSTNEIQCENEIYDVGNNYSDTVPVDGSNYVVPRDGNYNFTASFLLEGFFKAPAGSPSAVGNDGKWYLQQGIIGYINIWRETSISTPDILIGSEAFGIYDTKVAPLTINPSSTGVAPGATTYTPVAPTVASDDYFIPGFNNNRIVINNQNAATECNRFTATVTNIYLLATDRIYLEWSGGVALMEDYDVLSTGSWIDSTETETASTTYPDQGSIRLREGFYTNTFVNSGLAEGDTIAMNSTIPVKIKQRDFFMSIVNMFNLYVQSDTSNDKNLIIEPRNDFYLDGAANIVDWSKKLDISKPLELLPMGALDSKDYSYTYKQDKDYYNNLYNSTYDNRIYGDKIYDEYENDFLKNTKETKVIFSPTPSVGQAWYDRVIPTIIKTDSNGSVQRTQSNIRILQWGGMKSTAATWTHDDQTGSVTVKNTYPYAGMYDDPYSPTIDIGFGLTREIYWDDHAGAITFTNNNLFNKYYRQFIEEITNKDSKIARGSFYLNSSDIRALSFRKLYWFENAYFRLNKIENYNPQDPITKCEFLKIKDADVFSPSTSNTFGGVAVLDDIALPFYGNATGHPQNNNSIPGNSSVKVLGINNSISRSAFGIIAIGDNNKVFDFSKNIIIQGSNNIVHSGLQNITLINTDSVEVFRNNVTYINGQLKGNIETITSSDTTAEDVEVYLCDTSGGGISLQLNTAPTTVGQKWIIKVIDATNTVTVRATPNTIDGAATKSMTTLYETKTVMWDGSNYQIISEF